LRDADQPQVDAVEKMGIHKTWEALAQADLVMFVHDLPRASGQGPQSDAYRDADEQIASALREQVGASVPIMQIFNKVDEASEPALAAVKGVDENALLISAKTGQGLPELRKALLERVGWQAGTEGLFMARERHLEALREVAGQLDRAQQQLQSRPAALDLLAEDLRLAQQALAQITGAFTPDDLLGEIFSKFCIGK
jgi:tRNA modification GTPase